MKHTMKSLTLNSLALMLLSVFTAVAQLPPATVQTANVTMTAMAPTRVVAAASKAKYITTIKAESSGRVIEIAPIGTSKQAGDTLGLIADEAYALRINELNNAIASNQARVDYLESEAVRLASLKAQRLTSGTELDKNKADLKSAKADLEQTKSRLNQLEDDIRKLTPKAPYDGFVTQQLAQPGQFVNQGQDFLEMMSSGDLEIVAQIPFKYKSVIQPGKRWEYMDQMGQTHEAEVDRFIPAATSNSRLIQVYLNDLSGQLLPGEPIMLRVPETLPSEVKTVPRDALVLRRTGAHVFVVKEGKAIKVEVTTGLAQGELIAVSGDLAVGDEVVIRGNERLRDQQDVVITE